MKMTVFALVAAIAAIAAGGFAWQTRQALADANTRLAAATADAAKARQQAAAMQAQFAGLKKEAEQQKVAAEQLRSELTTTRAFLEAEKGESTRLRADLAAMKQQLASANRPRSAPAALPYAVGIVPTRPITIQAVRSGSAIGAASPAR